MRSKVIEIINEILVESGQPAINSNEITNESDLRNDLGLGSLDLAVLTVKLEDLTGIDVFENGVITKFGELIFQLEKAK
jgi:acyl carrier protein